MAVSACTAIPSPPDLRRCGSTVFMRAWLAADHNERLVWSGFELPSGNIIQKYANDATGSFTLMRVLPTGIACVMATGVVPHPLEPARLGV